MTAHHHPSMDMSETWVRERDRQMLLAANENKNNQQYPYRQRQIEDFTDPQLYSMQEPLHELSFPLTWPQQANQPLQRFMNDISPHFFSPTLAHNVFPSGLRAEGISSLPGPAMARMISPDPSYDQSSQASSAQSPISGDSEWYQNGSYPGYYSPQSIAQDTQSLDHGNGGARYNRVPSIPQDSFALDQFGQKQRPFPVFRPSMGNTGHISLNQVQSFADPQESQEVGDKDGNFEFDGSENYYYKGDPAPVSMFTPASQRQATYHRSIDEDLGSQKTQHAPRRPSTQNTPSNFIDTMETDVHTPSSSTYPSPQPSPAADDFDNDSDASFTPSRRAPRRRKNALTNPLGLNTKNARVRKPSTPAKTPGRKTKRKDDANSRPFICIFAFAGCHSTFPSKNEWKRHVSSQHVCLEIWICNQGACANSSRPNEFNRKDLFTQHLRRMHAPSSESKNSKKRNVEWEERLQTQCRRDKIAPPARTGCPMDGCEIMFEGATRDGMRKAWDDRMEHIGRHLDPHAGRNRAVDGERDVCSAMDVELVQWAERVGVIERVGGGWRLSGSEDMDVDAEGESE